MTVNQMPSHNHTATSTSNSSSTTTLRASSATGNTASPEGNVLADGRTARVYRDGTANAARGASDEGGSQPQNNMQPFLTLRACVVLEGIFPPRN